MGDAGKESGFQALVNNLIWDNGYTQVVCKPTRGGSLLDVYLLRPGYALFSCNVLPGISDHEGVLLEVEWSDKCRDDNAGRIVPMYHKTNVLGMQTFLREKYKQWAGIGSCVEEIWTNYKEIIFESIERYVPHKTLPKNPDPEYYKRLKG